MVHCNAAGVVVEESRVTAIDTGTPLFPETDVNPRVAACPKDAIALTIKSPAARR
jgi:hypothetical protein